MYGRTTNGLRASDVICRGHTTCSVTVCLMVSHEEILVTSTQNPNSLAVNGQTVDREALVKLLRLNYESFCYSVLLPQGGETFFDLSPANKLTLFSQIMGLDYWLEQSQKAAEESRKLDEEISSVQYQMATMGGKIDALSFTIDDLMIKANQWEGTQAAKLEKLTVELQDCLETCQYLGSIKQPEPFNLDEYNDLIQTLTEVDKELAVNDSKINEVKRAQRTVGGRCPVCLQPVNMQHLSLLTKHRLDLSKDREVLLTDKEVLNEERSKADTTRRAYVAGQEKASRAAYDLQILEREICQLRQRLLEVKEEKNQFGDFVTSKRNEYDTLQKALVLKEQQVDSLKEQYTAVSYWVAGFKRLRLYIVEEALKSLEIEVNNNLAGLGLANWKIEFDIEREKKDGGFSKGFSVLIISPSGSSIRLETFSGGESQLFRLAGALGLSNLICERAGLVNKQEFIDEGTTHLSQETISSFMELLHQRSIQTQRQIWVVDHNAVSFGDFQSVTTVVKDHNGSRIEV